MAGRGIRRVTAHRKAVIAVSTVRKPSSSGPVGMAVATASATLAAVPLST